MKKSFRKLISTSVALAAVACVTLSVPAQAMDLTQRTSIVGSNTSHTGETIHFFDIPIDGSVKPVTLDAIATITGSLVINPNLPEGEQFISPELSFTNRGSAPLICSPMEILNPYSTNLKIVSPDTFTDEEWKNLSAKDTEENMAFGLSYTNDEGEPGEYWFLKDSPKALFTIPGNETGSVQLIGKHGLAWLKAKSFQVRCYMRVDVKQ